MEVADDQINDEAAVDAAPGDQSVMTGSESEMSSNDQVISMLVGETNNAITQFVGDNIDIVKHYLYFHGNNPFYSMGWIKVTYPAPPLPDPHTTEAVPRVKLKALGKVKFRQS